MACSRAIAIAAALALASSAAALGGTGLGYPSTHITAGSPSFSRPGGAASAAATLTDIGFWRAAAVGIGLLLVSIGTWFAGTRLARNPDRPGGPDERGRRFLESVLGRDRYAPGERVAPKER